MAKYVVFDFDGTLVDSKVVFISTFNQLADKYRFKRIDDSNISYIAQLSIRERMRVLNVPFYKLPLLTAEFISLYKKSIHSIFLIYGMAHVLQELEKVGYKIAIVSSNAASSIKGFLEKNHLNHISDIYCSSKIFGKDKVINSFLNKNRLQAADIMYVGDEERDIVACKRSGVRIIWVAWGFDRREVVAKSQPHFMAYSPVEIVEIVKANL